MSDQNDNLSKLTNRQREIYDTILELGSMRKAAKALGVKRATIQDAARAMQKKGVLDLSPAAHREDLSMRRTCVHYDKQGQVVQEWRRYEKDREDLQKLTDELVKEVRGTVKVPKRRARKTDRNQYVGELALADAHMGMYAWAQETGRPGYDVDTAGDVVLAATQNYQNRVADLRPDTTVVALLGDQTHSDSRQGKTEKGGNILDTDSRYQRVISHARRCFTEAIAMAADVSGQVIVQVVPGNHDWHFSHCLAQILDAAYAGNDHIHVDTSARARKALVFDQVMLAWAHGDNVAKSDWGSLVPTEFPREWGLTRHRFVHLGHVHHRVKMWGCQVDTQRGLTVEYLRALCPIDAWHYENGFVGAVPGCDAFLYHRQYGLDTQWSWNSENVLMG